MTKRSRIVTLGVGLAILKTLSGFYHRVYGEGGAPPSVSFYVANVPAQSTMVEYLRAPQVARPAYALSGSNTVPLAGSAHGTSSAIGRLTARP